MWYTTALSFFMKYWGKIIAAAFIVAWIAITIGLYSSNNTLHTKLGTADAATAVCISNSKGLDEELKTLKKDIKSTQDENTEYKAAQVKAQADILKLEEKAIELDIDIVKTKVPQSCEGAINYMLNEALKN